VRALRWVAVVLALAAGGVAVAAGVVNG
jgi:hypothetical protein